jgi:hypothetical protein
MVLTGKSIVTTGKSIGKPVQGACPRARSRNDKRGAAGILCKAHYHSSSPIREPRLT